MINVDKSKGPFYIGYNMLTECLKTNNISDGIPRALDMAKIYTESSDLIIYKKSEDGKHHLFKTSTITNINAKEVETIINNIDIDSINGYLTKEINENRIDNLSIIKLFKNDSYLLVLINNNIKDNEENMQFMEVLRNTFKIIIERMKIHLHLTQKSEIDELTGLKNRQAYQQKIDYLNRNPHIPVVFTVLDLFRLKYVNDNINHSAGDYYIKKTAEILKEHFPEYIEYKKGNGETTRKKTGDTVYRIGGDEFVIISENKKENQIEALIEYVLLETEAIKFETHNEVIKGINYGISKRNNNEQVEKLYIKADKELSKDKAKIYKRLGINRRK